MAIHAGGDQAAIPDVRAVASAALAVAPRVAGCSGGLAAAAATRTRSVSAAAGDVAGPAARSASACRPAALHISLKAHHSHIICARPEYHSMQHTPTYLVDQHASMAPTQAVKARHAGSSATRRINVEATHTQPHLGVCTHGARHPPLMRCTLARRHCQSQPPRHCQRQLPHQPAIPAHISTQGRSWDEASQPMRFIQAKAKPSLDVPASSCTAKACSLLGNLAPTHAFGICSLHPGPLTAPRRARGWVRARGHLQTGCSKTPRARRR